MLLSRFPGPHRLLLWSNSASAYGASLANSPDVYPSHVDPGAASVMTDDGLLDPAMPRL